MSSSASSVADEKTIASYESSFKESSFSKPQDVYLTVSVAHVYGKAYVMEQQGTSEADPIYQRFVCSLDEITKVYINDNVKSSPLFIQCDKDIKGVVHRKRIIVPNLPNVEDIVDQINEIKATFMLKLNAQQDKIKEQRIRELEEERANEIKQAELAARKRLINGPTLSKLAKVDDILSDNNDVVSKSNKGVSLKNRLAHIAKYSKDDKAADVKVEMPQSMENAVANNIAAEWEAEEKAKADKAKAERLRAQRLEEEKQAKERKEKERLEAEKLAEEKAFQEQFEAERLAKEKALQEKFDAKKKAQEEKLKAEKLAEEKKAQEEKPVKKKAEPKAAVITNSAEKITLAEFEVAIKELKAQLDNGDITAADFTQAKKDLRSRL